jgi:hypothetical protein
MLGNFDPTPGEADVNGQSRSDPTASYAQNYWIRA